MRKVIMSLAIAVSAMLAVSTASAEPQTVIKDGQCMDYEYSHQVVIPMSVVESDDDAVSNQRYWTAFTCNGVVISLLDNGRVLITFANKQGNGSDSLGFAGTPGDKNKDGDIVVDIDALYVGQVRYSMSEKTSCTLFDKGLSCFALGQVSGSLRGAIVGFQYQ